MNKYFDEWISDCKGVQLDRTLGDQRKEACGGGFESGKKLIKDKVSKRFAISHIDWREYERTS